MAGVRIAIVTVASDIHAHVIKDELQSRGGAECLIIEVDRLSSAHPLSWQICEGNHSSYITVEGIKIDPSEIDLIWWRRSRSVQCLSHVYPEDQKDVIDSDCRGAFLGAFITEFRGKWISHPWHTERAGNKLFQLIIAEREGFNVPRTLVSQHPDEVRTFCDSNPNGTIAKTVAGGSKNVLMFTEFVTRDKLVDMDESISVSPTIYQAYVPGNTHIRLNCFGMNSYAASIETSELDWRPNLNVPVRPWRVPVALHIKIRRVLDALGLEMGIVDLKLTPSGKIYWLEVNPQGQFLFLEPLTGESYTRIFAEYLLFEARSSSSASQSGRDAGIVTPMPGRG